MLLKIFIYFIYLRHCCCLQTHRKRVMDSITDGCEPPCGCWELSSGPLEEQSMLLPAEPSLQPNKRFLGKEDFITDIEGTSSGHKLQMDAGTMSSWSSLRPQWTFGLLLLYPFTSRGGLSSAARLPEETRAQSLFPVLYSPSFCSRQRFVLIFQKVSTQLRDVI